MSFYVDTQEEALQIGLSHFRPDLAALTLDQIKSHPDVTVTEEKITNLFDLEGKHATNSIMLDVKNIPVIIGSGPFRDGYDIWAFDRKTGRGMRIGP